MIQFTLPMLERIVAEMPATPPRPKICQCCGIRKPKASFEPRDRVCLDCRAKATRKRQKNTEAVRRWRERNPNAEKTYRHEPPAK